MDNAIFKALLKGTRHSSPIKKVPIYKKTMSDFLDNFKNAENNFMSLRNRQNAIAQKRIEKCNRTIQKC